MVDWSGHAGQPTEYRYRSMAERQLRGISPSYERICLGVAGDAELIALLDRGDLLTDLAALAAGAPPEATLVVFHSAVLAYLAEEQRGTFRDELAALAAERPTVWVSNEGPGVVVDLPIPAGPVPFLLARDGVPLATTSPHGDWIAWLP